MADATTLQRYTMVRALNGTIVPLFSKGGEWARWSDVEALLSRRATTPAVGGSPECAKYCPSCGHPRDWEDEDKSLCPSCIHERDECRYDDMTERRIDEDRER